MEQTSSAAYPNILVVDYVKKARVASPQLLLKAEEYLNVGYQKLLTFERPGGGFDWWGSGEPLVWLSAYGLMEFTDMARVYPIDKGVIERMGDPKLLLTSYVAWALLESGQRGAPVEKAVGYIRRHVKAAENAYIL